MARTVTLFTGQWADMDLELLCQKAASFGFDGLEIACWGGHIDINQSNDNYCRNRLNLLKKYDLQLHAISNHLVGQAVCDRIDNRHKEILPEHVWGDGSPEGVRQRAAAEMIKTAETAARLGIKIVTGFTGSSIWHLLYSFPPVSPELIHEGFSDFKNRWTPILDEFHNHGIKFALEVHPTEIAFDIASAERALEAVDYHPAFGFNYDPSHLGYQGVDYLNFIYRFKDRIFHVHMKDVHWSDKPTDVGVFGGHVPFGDRRRFWDFRSPGRGKIEFEGIIRALNHIGYQGPLSVEWEDSAMNREEGAKEACEFIKRLDFSPSDIAFDASFKED